MFLLEYISPLLVSWTLCFQILLKTQFQVLAKRCYNPEEAIKAGNWKIANLCDFLCIQVSNNIFWILVYSVYFSCCRDHDYGANNLVGHHGLLSGCLVHEGGSERVRVVRDDGAGAAHLRIRSTCGWLWQWWWQWLRWQWWWWSRKCLFMLRWRWSYERFGDDVDGLVF